MKRINKPLLGLILIVILLPISCAKAFNMNLEIKGDMEVTLDPETMRTARSGLDTEPASYRIEGTHSGGAAFDITSLDTSLQINDLQIGEWDLRVRAYNSAGQIVAEGTGTLTVEPGGLSAITLMLYNAVGTGSLDFNLIWNPDLLANESLTITLTTLGGDAVAMQYTADSGVASGLTDQLGAGFYKLDVQLWDGAAAVMGAVEMVLIHEGTATTVDLDFTQINKPGQVIPLTGSDFTISWNSDSADADDFRLYYREHGTYNWIFLGSTGSGSILDFTVDQTMLAYGTYDFAVSSIREGAESELHTSMDDTAVPATGWYIDWTS